MADTGTWLTNRLVLISPFAITGVNFEHQNIEVKLTKEQIENSPSIDTEKPVSRQFEADYARYFGWPMYWYGPALWDRRPIQTTRPTKSWSAKPRKQIRRSVRNGAIRACAAPVKSRAITSRRGTANWGMWRI